MHVTVEKGLLLRTVSHAAGIVERRNTIPILSHVCLNAGGDKGGLMLRATDLQRQITETINAHVFQAGALCVPAAMLHDIVRKLPDGSEVELKEEHETKRLIVKAGRSNFALMALPASDFPLLNIKDHEIDAPGAGGDFSVPAQEFKMILDKTRFAMSTEETRYYLNGIYMHYDAEANPPLLRSAATDGHRLARVDIEAPEGCSNMPGVIVPRKTVDLFHRLISDQESEVRVQVSGTIISIEIGSLLLHSKLVDGTYPDYNRVIPDGSGFKVTIPTPELFSAVDRVATMAGDKANRIIMTLGNGKLKLEVKNANAGDAAETIDVAYHEDDFKIGFNARYILATLSVIDSPKTTMCFDQPSAPVLITPENDDAKTFIVMPMNAN